MPRKRKHPKQDQQPQPASEPRPKNKPITITRPAISSAEAKRISKFYSDSHEIERQYLRIIGY